MSTYLITGTSRGIGLEMVKQFLELSQDQVGQIIAVTRSRSDSLQKLIENSPKRVKNVVIEDIGKESSVRKAIPEIEEALQGRGLDVLINNAGASSPVTPKGLQSLSEVDLLEAFKTNVLSAHVMTSVLLPLLQQGKEKKIINVSTTLSSITAAPHTTFMPTHAYKITKAAMNMMSAQYAADLKEQGFTVLAVSPGWLKTDLGTENAHLDPSVGVDAVKHMILSADPSVNGKFLDIKVPGWEGMYDGKEISW